MTNTHAYPKPDNLNEICKGYNRNSVRGYSITIPIWDPTLA